MLTAILLLAQAVTPPPASVCDAPAFAQFDFWVGEWDVYPRGADVLIAHSKIERLYGGCAVRENWMPLKGTGGGSLNGYDPVTGRWHQTWLGSRPGRAEFDGGLAGQAMVLTGYAANGSLLRMSYSPLPDGSVRQHGETSSDQGLTWADSFDFVYKRSVAGN